MKTKVSKSKSQGWKVWVWRAPCVWATPRSRIPGNWSVHVSELYEDGDAPRGGLQDAGAVIFKVYASEWLAMNGGELSDIPRKPTLMVLRGTARKVTK